jgi:hypothetical protein
MSDVAVAQVSGQRHHMLGDPIAIIGTGFERSDCKCVALIPPAELEA